MSTYVNQILTQLKSIVSTQLGSASKELRYVYEVEKNDLRVAKLGYGVRPLSASTAESVTRSYTLDHGFEVVLTDVDARSDNDSQKATAINTMYNQADEIFKDIVNTKVNLASFVLNVFDPSIEEPEILHDKKIIVLRLRFTIKYRSLL